MAAASGYHERVRQRFAVAAHAGTAAGPAASVARGRTRIVLSAAPDAGRLAAVRYRVLGCPHTIAAADLLCETLEGSAIASLTALNVREIMQELEIPVEKTGQILLLEDAASALYREITAQDATKQWLFP